MALKGLRAVYFQRGLKHSFPQTWGSLRLRAVYFQRGLKPLSPPSVRRVV